MSPIDGRAYIKIDKAGTRQPVLNCCTNREWYCMFQNDFMYILKSV